MSLHAEGMLLQGAPLSALLESVGAGISPTLPARIMRYGSTATPQELERFASIRLAERHAESDDWEAYWSRTRDGKAERARRYDLLCARAQLIAHGRIDGRLQARLSALVATAKKPVPYEPTTQPTPAELRSAGRHQPDVNAYYRRMGVATFRRGAWALTRKGEQAFACLRMGTSREPRRELLRSLVREGLARQTGGRLTLTASGKRYAALARGAS